MDSDHTNGSAGSVSKNKESRKKGKNGQSAQGTENGEQASSTPNAIAARQLNFRNIGENELRKANAAVSSMVSILEYAHHFKGLLGECDNVYGLLIKQHEEIEDLKSKLDTTSLFSQSEVRKLFERVSKYEDCHEQFQKDREALNNDTKSAKDVLADEKSKLESKAADELAKMKNQLTRQFEDKKGELVKQHKAESTSMKERHQKKVSKLESRIAELVTSHAGIELRLRESDQIWREKCEDQKIDCKASKVLVKSLESKLAQFRPLVEYSSRSADHYSLGFSRLREIIEDVAINDLKDLPDDEKMIKERNALHYGIFKDIPLCYDRPASTFLRCRALQAAISSSVMSVIRRPYFVEQLDEGTTKSVHQDASNILEAIAAITSENADVERSWRSVTLNKLDRLCELDDARSGPKFVTRPSEAGLTTSLLEEIRALGFFVNKPLEDKLGSIAGIAVELWEALRCDGCQLDYNDSPPTCASSDWDFAQFEENTSQAVVDTNSGTTMGQLPTEPYALFPRVTATCIEGRDELVLLCKGTALSNASPAFGVSLKEANDVEHLIKRARRGTISQSSSPAILNQPHQWRGKVDLN